MVIGDRYYCSYWLIAALVATGADGIFRQHVLRKVDFREGVRLGVRDHIVTWRKPAKPAWMGWQAYEQTPDEIRIREVQVGGRVLVTTFLNPRDVSKKEVGWLYEQRWQMEVDLNAIKTTLEMNILRCKTPEMVEKEIVVYLLGYNLIRAVMVQSAWHQGIRPREISFKATIQMLNAFRESGLLHDEESLPGIRRVLFKAIAEHRVMNRPGRIEPRVVKRRPKQYHRMMQPRSVLQEALLNARLN